MKRRPRWRATLVAMLVLGMLASLLALTSSPTVAGAEEGPEVTRHTSFPTDCYGISTPLNAGAEEANAINVDVTAPSAVRQGDSFTVRIAPQPASQPAAKVTVAGVVGVYSLNDVEMMFDLPAGTSFVSAAVVPGSGFGTQGTPTVSLDEGYTPARVVLGVPYIPDDPQPPLGYTAFQLPAIDVTVQATGPVGTVAETRFSGHDVTDAGYTFAAASATLATVWCWAKGGAGAPALSGTTIAAAGVAATTTSLAAGPSAIPSGNEVELTATVGLPGTPGRPLGTVELFDGATSLGEADVDPTTGTATLDAVLDGVGTHLVTARYEGADGFFAPSSSSAVPVTVTDPAGRDATLVEVAVGPSTAGEAGSTVAMIIDASVVSVGDPAPRTGKVRLLDNGTQIDEAELVDSATTFEFFPQTRTGHVFTVVYPGDTNFEGSTGTASKPSYLGPDRFALPLGGSINLNAAAAAALPDGSTYSGTFPTDIDGNVSLAGTFPSIPLTLVSGGRTLTALLNQAGPADGQVDTEGDATLDTTLQLQVTRLEDGPDTFELASGCALGPFPVHLTGSRDGAGLVSLSQEDFAVPATATGCLSTTGTSVVDAVNAALAGASAELSIGFTPPFPASPSTVTLSVSGGGSTPYGEPITLTASVASAGPNNTAPASIVYYDGDTVLGMGPYIGEPPPGEPQIFTFVVPSAFTLTYVTNDTSDVYGVRPPLAVGEHHFSARLNAVTTLWDPNDFAAGGQRPSPRSAVVDHTVTAAVSPVPLSVGLEVTPASSSAVGTSVSMTATVSPAPESAGSTPPLAGKMYFFDGGTNLLGPNVADPTGSFVTVEATSDGVVTQEVTLAPGTHELRAEFHPYIESAWRFAGPASSPVVDHTITGSQQPTEVVAFDVNPAGGRSYLPATVVGQARVTAGIAGNVAYGVNGQQKQLSAVDPATGLAPVWNFSYSGGAVPGAYELSAVFTPTDNAYAPSSATRAHEVISPFRVPTETTLTMTPTGDVVAGAILTWAVAVVAPATGLRAGPGTVQLYDGATPVGAAVAWTVNSTSVGGRINSVTPGVHDYRAVYTPNPAVSFRGVRSDAFFGSETTVTVNGLTPGTPAPTTVDLGVFYGNNVAAEPVPGIALAGRAVTLQARVTPNMLGTVQFYRDETPLGSPVTWQANSVFVSSASQATTAGTANYRAVFTPTSPYYAPSEDQEVRQFATTGLATTTTVRVVAPEAAVAGDSVNLQAFVSPVGTAAFGNVQFYAGATPIGAPVAVSGAAGTGLNVGRANLSTTEVPVGSHTITAAFTPTNPAVFGPSTSAGVPLEVLGAPTDTTTSLAVSPSATSPLGDAVTLTASVTPGLAGTVSFVDGVTPLGTATVAGAQAVLVTTSLGAGQHDLAAIFTPQWASAHVPSSSAPVAHLVTTATTTALSVSPSGSSWWGQDVILGATVTPSNASGEVTFFDGDVEVGSSPVVAGQAEALARSDLSPGAHQLRAEFSDGAAFADSESAPVAHEVAVVGTGTVLTVTPPSGAAVGETVTLTATVDPEALDGQVAGSVTFLDGAAELGVVAVVDGEAVLETDDLSVGEHSLTAVFAGEVPFGGSISDEVDYEVASIETTTALAVSPSGGSLWGAPVSLTATVSPAGAPGAVTFFDGATELGSDVVEAGVAVLATDDLAPGEHSLTAVFEPSDTSYAGSTSEPVDHEVTVTETQVTLVVSPAVTSPQDEPVTLTATLDPVGATGTVTFFDGVVEVGSQPVVAGGAEVVLTNLAIGEHDFSAEFEGTAPFADAGSAVVEHTVTEPIEPVQTTTALVVSPSGTSLEGADVTLTATVGPSEAPGSVTFLDGGTEIGEVAVTTGSAVLVTDDLSIGAHELSAVYESSSELYLDSVSPEVAHTVAAQVVTTTGLTVSPAGSSLDGENVTLAATVSPSAAPGTVAFFDGATELDEVAVVSGQASLVLDDLSVGSHSFTAVFESSDPGYLDSQSGAVAHTVTAPAATTTSLAVTPASPTEQGTALTLTATVAPSGAVGSVTFRDGSTVLGTQPLAAGQASLGLPNPSVGSHSFTAQFVPSLPGHLGSTSGAVAHTVTSTSVATTTALTVSPASPAELGTEVTFTATVSPSAATGSVVFRDSGVDMATVTVVGGVATLATGSFEIGSRAFTAQFQPSAAPYLASTSNSVPYTITPPAGVPVLTCVGADQTSIDAIKIADPSGVVMAPTPVITTVPSAAALGVSYPVAFEWVVQIPEPLAQVASDLEATVEIINVEARIAASGGAVGEWAFPESADVPDLFEPVSFLAEGDMTPTVDELITYDLVSPFTMTIDVKPPWSVIVNLDCTVAPTFVGSTVIDDSLTVPSPPLNVVAQGQNLQATVSWDAPADDGGSPVEGYEVRNGSGTVVATTTADVTSVAVIGLAAGSSQSFTVVAWNAQGASDPSAASAAVMVTPPSESFSDTPPSAPFYAEINWAIVAGITNGYEDGTFKGASAVSRQAMAAFLYRFAGEPAYTAPTSPSFNDVAVGAPFYKEIEWLVATGITTGYPDGNFLPANAVSRQAMAAFLYRFAGEPAFTAPSSPSFGDVPVGAPFFKEIEWLAQTGITEGYSDGTFKPAQAVSRQAMVTFLYRYTLAFVPAPPPLEVS